jgi:hypothetical protein
MKCKTWENKMQIETIKNDLIKLELEDNLSAATLLYICGSARRMKRKMSALIEGHSGYGKSYAVEEVLKLYPEEERMDISTITQAGLMRLGNVEQMILCILEKYNDTEVDLVLRELMSQGKATRHITIGNKVEELTLEGPPTIFTTAITSNKFSHENRSRSYAVGINVTEGARANILSIQKRQRTLVGVSTEKIKEAIRVSHQKFQRGLRKHLQVVLPFAERIRTPKHTYPRTLERFLNLVEAIAYVQQSDLQVKNVNGTDYVEATEADFHSARDLLQNLYVNEGEQELPQEAIVFGKELLTKRETLMNKPDFTRDDLLRVFPQFNSFKPIKWRLELLIDAGKVLVTKRGGSKNSYAYRLEDKFLNTEPNDLDGNCYSGFSLT